MSYLMQRRRALLAAMGGNSQGEQEVDDGAVVCTYNVTDVSSATKIINTTQNLSSVWIDGVQGSIETTHQFDTTGTHKIRFYYPNNIYYLPMNAFTGCTALTHVFVPSVITTLNYADFKDCSNLLSVKLPSTLTGMSSGYLFTEAKSLVEVNIPEGVTVLGGDYTFHNNWSLPHIELPSTLTKIGNGAFNNCNSMEYIIIRATTPPEITASSSTFNSNGCPIYVPDESVAAYKAETNWAQFESRILPLSQFS